MSGTDQIPEVGPIELSVGEENAGLRLDRFLAARLTGLSRVRIQSLIRSGRVGTEAGTLLDPAAKVKPGQSMTILIPEAEPAAPAAEIMPIAVVFEDEHLIVIDKPAGLVVHPAAGHAGGTLVNALLAHCGDSLSGIGGVKRPGIVHRLDKDTSGLIVVAKTDAAHAGLAIQFAAHGADGKLSRRYVAFAWGVPAQPRGTIDAPLARSATHRTRIAVSSSQQARRAVTHYSVSGRFQDAGGKPLCSRLECTLETGRTHQIRVHLAHIGHPIMGDRVYGAHFSASAHRLGATAREALAAIGRQALHAAHLGFAHPLTGKKLAFDSALPADLAQLERALQE